MSSIKWQVSGPMVYMLGDDGLNRLTARVYDCRGATYDEACAAAVTFAAAPDMLEALSLVADYLMGDDDIPENIADAINAAIKKARGQS